MDKWWANSSQTMNGDELWDERHSRRGHGHPGWSPGQFLGYGMGLGKRCAPAITLSGSVRAGGLGRPREGVQGALHRDICRKASQLLERAQNSSHFWGNDLKLRKQTPRRLQKIIITAQAEAGIVSLSTTQNGKWYNSWVIRQATRKALSQQSCKFTLD